MSENANQLTELFEAQQQRNAEIIDQVGKDLRTVFSDDKQYEVVYDLYKQVFKNTNDVEELNHASMFLSSYIDAFYEHLVGDTKVITEEQFREAAQKAYQASLDTVVQASAAATE